MGHVNNAVYLTYLEAARIPYYLLLSGQAGAPRTDMILASVTCDYRSPALYPESLIVGVRVEELRSRSFTLSYRIEEANTGRLVATGTSVQVAYDYAARVSKRVPDEFIAGAESYEGRPLRGASSGAKAGEEA